MARKRYVIRLHKDIRARMDEESGKKGHLTPTFISLILEEELAKEDILPYKIGDTERTFQPRPGGGEGSADKQMSIYLTDFAYGKIEEITAELKRKVDRKIGAAFVIRDILYRWLPENREG